MGRGIISVKAPTGSGSLTNGKVIVTNGKNTYGGGLSVMQGAVISFTDQDLWNCDVGNIVDFTVTEVTHPNGQTVKTASSFKPSAQANGQPINNVPFVYDPASPTDYTLTDADSMYALISGPWSGSFTVNGGTLVLSSDPSNLPPAGTFNAYSGALTSQKDGSCIVIDNQISLQKATKIENDTDISIRNSQIESKISLVIANKAHLILRNTNIDGTLNAI